MEYRDKTMYLNLKLIVTDWLATGEKSLRGHDFLGVQFGIEDIASFIVFCCVIFLSNICFCSTKTNKNYYGIRVILN